MISNMEITFVTLVFFVSVFIFNFIFTNATLAAFHRRAIEKSKERERYFYLVESGTGMGGKLARRDKLGSCFKRCETKREEKTNEGKCITGIQ